MGVRGLWRLLDAFGEVTQPDEWVGRRVAVDASIWINQFRAQCKAGENVEQRVLEGFLLRILKLLFYRIYPIFVFDGPATSSKLAERRRRAEQRVALERAALMKRAKQIVAAQLSSGVLDLQALKQEYLTALTASRQDEEGVKTEQEQTEKKQQASSDDETNGHCDNREVSQGCVSDAAPTRSVFKRRREVAGDLCDLSRNVTENFLSEAAEWIAERKRGEMCVKTNVLAYSSSSLFMGPRNVVEKEGKTDALVPMATSTQPIVVCDAVSSESIFISSSGGSSLIIDDDRCSNFRDETVSSSLSSNCSVMVLDNIAGTIVSHLREMDEAVSDSVGDSFQDLNFKENGSNSEGDIYSFEKDSTGGGSEANNQNKSDSYDCWNPGTQLISWKEAKESVGASERFVEDEHDEEKDKVVKKNNHEFAQFHCFSDKQKLSEGQYAASSQQSRDALLLPLPPQYCYSQAPSTRQAVPFHLLGIVELLDCCGIPFVLSPSEADAQCALLSQQQLVDAVFTEDSDVVVHGATVVLRGFFAKGRHVIAYRQRDLLTHGVDKDVLVALALLLGCDYTEGVPGLSLLDALRVIAAFWRGGSAEENSSHVGNMLTSWKTAITGGICSLDNSRTGLQFYNDYAKWKTLRVGADFPRADVIDLFFNPAVDAQLSKSFVKAAEISPDWRRLRAFAGMHGLLESSTCRQLMELAQKELMARELQNTGKQNDQQLKITDFVGRSGKKRQCAVYKKQSSKIAAVLAALRRVRQSEECADC